MFKLTQLKKINILRNLKPHTKQRFVISLFKNLQKKIFEKYLTTFFIFLQNPIQLCDRTHYEENGIVHSPRLPDNRYPQNADCTIKLRTAKQHQLQIYFNSFDLESSENCANDFVKVGNGQKLCGNKLPDPVFPKSEKVDIIFHSNDYWEGFGFSLSYVSNFAGCGGLITGYGGNIYSTDYPKAYGDDLNCEWQIVAPSENTPIKLDFKNIAIFSDSDGCFKDEALEIYSGTVDEPQQQLIDNACGVSGQFIQIHYIYDCNVFFMN